MIYLLGTGLQLTKAAVTSRVFHEWLKQKPEVIGLEGGSYYWLKQIAVRGTKRTGTLRLYGLDDSGTTVKPGEAMILNRNYGSTWRRWPESQRVISIEAPMLLATSPHTKLIYEYNSKNGHFKIER